MRRLIMSSAVVAVASIIWLLAAPGAQAMTVPMGMTAAFQAASPVQSVELVCRRVRRCGPYGCAWRRQCWETGPRYYGGYDYGYRGGYAPRNPCGPGWSVQDGVCKPYRGY